MPLFKVFYFKVCLCALLLIGRTIPTFQTPFDLNTRMPIVTQRKKKNKFCF